MSMRQIVSERCNDKYTVVRMQHSATFYLMLLLICSSAAGFLLEEPLLWRGRSKRYLHKDWCLLQALAVRQSIPSRFLPAADHFDVHINECLGNENPFVEFVGVLLGHPLLRPVKDRRRFHRDPRRFC